MKYLVRVFAFSMFALWLAGQTLPALVISGSWQVIVLAGFILSLLTVFVAPLLRILFIPINFITFGLFSWTINVIVFYLLTLFVPEVQVVEWLFPGGSWAGFVVPSFHLNYLLSLIVTTFWVTLIINVLHKISEG